MKKYILRLIAEDLRKDRNFLNSALKMVDRYPSDDYWKRRKKQHENSITKKEAWLLQVSAMDLKANRITKV